MVNTLSFTSQCSEFVVNFHPPIGLDNQHHEIGLLLNTIPNIDETNNKIHFIIS